MSHKIFCRKFQQEMDGLDRPPYPGAKGQDIYDNVSKQAWEEWQAHQTMLINEHHLNMMEPSARAFLQEQLDKFLAGEDYAKAEGYVPPRKMS